MNTQLLFTFFILFSELVPGGTREEGLLNQLRETKESPSRERIVKLSETLERFYRFRNSSSPEEVAHMNRVRDEFCAISGHARFIGEEIEQLRNGSADGDSPEDNDRLRMWLFERLGCLPSPETVWVLGNYLHDDNDFRAAVLVGPEGEKHVSGGRAPNSLHAVDELIKLRIRNSPFSERDDIDRCRFWWEEVKSGRMAFSFNGQNVEYRFKPDGTWDTIALVNPPDDAPKPPTVNQEKKERIEKRVPQALETKETRTSGNAWAWIVGAVMVLLVGLVWLRGKKRMG